MILVPSVLVAYASLIPALIFNDTGHGKQYNGNSESSWLFSKKVYRYSHAPPVLSLNNGESKSVKVLCEFWLAE